MLSQNGPDFWFPGGAGNWQKCPIVRDVPSSTYQILAQIAWSVNLLSSVLLPRNRKKGRCCHKMARISGFQVALGIDKNVRLWEMFLLPHTKFWPKLHGPLIFYLVFSFAGTGKKGRCCHKMARISGFPGGAGHWQKCPIIRDVPSSTHQILAQIA